MFDRKLLIGLVVGLLVGAGLVLVSGLGSGDDDGGSVDTTPVELPERVGAFVPLPEAIESFDGSGREELIARTQRSEMTGAEVVSAARGGAAAVVRDYSNSEIELVTVIAVRASSSPLIAYSFTDPEELGLSAPPEEVVKVGEVECLVRNVPTFDEDEPSEGFASFCQRTGDDLTVQVLPRGQYDVAELAVVVDDAWVHIAGEG